VGKEKLGPASADPSFNKIQEIRLEAKINASLLPSLLSSSLLASS
jgi:hypothetical protein